MFDEKLLKEESSQYIWLTVGDKKICCEFLWFKNKTANFPAGMEVRPIDNITIRFIPEKIYKQLSFTPFDLEGII